MTTRILKKYKALTPDCIVILWLAVWWVLNLLVAGGSELAHDEAYYHMFAQNLGWGYFDHPPFTALLVWMGEHLFGGELGVRFFFTILQPLYLWVLWRLVRPVDSDRKDAELYVMLAASTLMLQLYGFIAVPDGPLMFTAALFLAAFKAFTSEKKWSWLWLGVAMAAMAYSKYHGALVVIFALAVNWRQLLRWQLYAAGAIALVLLVPHLWWQYTHDWASFAYHLADRNSDFDPEYISSYVLNLVVVFNPFFVPLYFKAWKAMRPNSATERVLKFLPAAFIIFFLISSLRGYVQPQWVIVAVFGLVATMFAYVRRHPRTRRYVMRMGWVTLVLMAIVRCEMIFNPLGIRFEVFNNHETFDRVAEIAEGRPVVFNSGYAVAAKYNFYTDGEAFCEPNIFYRTHHWQFRDDDDRFAGREVVVETWKKDVDSLLEIHHETLANGKEFVWKVDPCYHAVRRIAIDYEGIGEQVSVGDGLSLNLKVENPYPYAVELGRDAELAMVWKHGRFRVEEFKMDARGVIPAQGELDLEVEFTIPESLAEEDFKVGFTLRKVGYAHWFNGKPKHVKVSKL